MAEVTGVMRQTMLTLSGAPDHVANWSDFPLQHNKIRKLNRICRTTFSSFYRICHFNYKLVLCGRWSSVVVEL